MEKQVRGKLDRFYVSWPPKNVLHKRALIHTQHSLVYNKYALFLL